MLLAVRILSYRCTWEVWRALKKLELLSAVPRATLTLLSCSPNFPCASGVGGTPRYIVYAIVGMCRCEGCSFQTICSRIGYSSI